MDLEPRAGITVAELIDMLSQYPADTVVEMSIIAPVGDGDDDITVDRYPIDGVMPWDGDEDDDESDGSTVVWLVGGDDDDVELFLDAIEVDPG